MIRVVEDREISRIYVILTFRFLFNDIHCGFDSSPDITLLEKFKNTFSLLLWKRTDPQRVNGDCMNSMDSGRGNSKTTAN